MTPDPEFSVLLTTHFVKRSRDPHTKFPSRHFWRCLPAFARLAEANPERQCMVRLSECKIVFASHRNNDGTIKLVFITAMPYEYKHNIFKRAVTEDLGEIETLGLME